MTKTLQVGVDFCPENAVKKMNALSALPRSFFAFSWPCEVFVAFFITVARSGIKNFGAGPGPWLEGYVALCFK